MAAACRDVILAWLTAGIGALYCAAVGASSTVGRLVGLALLAVTVVTLLGHVCIPPSVAAATVPSQASPPASHVSICAVVVGKTQARQWSATPEETLFASSLPARVPIVALIVAGEGARLHRGDVGPLLFLLHAALRI